MYHLIKYLSRHYFFIIIGILIFLFLTSASMELPLNVYTPGNATYTTTSRETGNSISETQNYQSSRISFSMQIPAGWEYVLKDGYDTYIHAASASSVQIQIRDYAPDIHSVCYESLSREYSSNGFIPTSYEQTSPNAYYFLYQSHGLSGVTDYIEYVLWDYGHIVKIVFTCNDSYYLKMEQDIWNCIESIRWNYESPVFEDLHIYYDEIGNFEFGLPCDWIVTRNEKAFFAFAEEWNASITVNLLEDSTYIDEVSELDYVHFLSENKADFILTTFSQNENSIYGEATYRRNDQLTSLIQYYYANGFYHYIFTYEFPNEYGETIVPLFRHALDSIRIYDPPENTAAPDPEENVPTNEEYELQKLQIEENFQQMQEELPASNENEASSFAEALVMVSGISPADADYITEIWEANRLPEPVYADLVSESDNLKIIEITDSENVTYELYIDGNEKVVNIQQK